MPRSPYSLRMSATAGPMVPSISGRLLDLLVPSSVTVMDRLAEPLMRVSLLPKRAPCPQLGACRLGGARDKIMADCRPTQPSRLQHAVEGQGFALKRARGLCPLDPQQRRSLCNPSNGVTGSKGYALGGVPRG